MCRILKINMHKYFPLCNSWMKSSCEFPLYMSKYVIQLKFIVVNHCVLPKAERL